MKRRWVIVVALACVVGAVVIAFVWGREREPSYKGKTLSQLLITYKEGFRPDTGQREPGAEQAGREAVKGLREIGTNALPWLLSWIGDEPWEAKVMEAGDHLPGPLKRAIYERFEGALIGTRQKHFKRFEAAFFCFMLLGEKATPAIPALTRRMNDPESSPFRKHTAVRALAYIGKEGLPSLLDALNDKQSANHEVAAISICQMASLGTNAKPVVPAVVGLLSDRTLAGSAAHVLGSWGIEPDIVVPALVKTAQEPKKNIFLRCNSIESLGKFGARARPAVPVLPESLGDVDGNIRHSATNALRKIAPEVLPRER